MSATISGRPLTDATALRQRLTTLRHTIRRVTLLRGISMILAVFLGVGLILALLDWTWSVPALVRAFFLTLLLAGSLVIGYRYLIRPLRERLDDLALALRIEDNYPALNDSLASSVQFLDQPDSPANAGSAPLRREAVRRALAAAASCDFERIVDREGLAPALAVSFLAINLIWPLFVFAPTLASTALARLLNPFGIHEWPRQTQIELVDLRQRIGRGEPFDVHARLKGVIPENARVVFSTEGFPPFEQRGEVKRDVRTESGGFFTAHLEPDKVQHTFRFQVFANDNFSDEIQVEVLEPPVLVSLNGRPSPQVDLYFPAYTDLPSPFHINPGDGNIDAVLGTEVLFQAAANRPLSKAWIEFVPENRAALPMTLLAPLGTDHLLPLLTTFVSSGNGSRILPATLDTTRTKLSARFQPRQPGLYVLFFEDDIGLSGKRPFDLRLKADPAPVVTLERPSPSRDILQMLPNATVNLQAWAEDLQYAVRSVTLRYRTTNGQIAPTGAAVPLRTLPLYDHATAREQLVPVLGGSVLGWTSFRPRPTRVDVQRYLSLKQIQHPNGEPLKEGDTVVLQVMADDFDDVTVDKQPGLSHEVEIRIIGSNAMDLVLNQEQTVVQQELLRLREKERDAIQKVLDVERRLKRNEKLTPEDQNQLSEADQVQQQIRERVGDEEKGLRGQIKRIQETLRQNGMENSAIKERMTDVANELERLTERDLPQVEARLTTAAKSTERQAQLEEKARDNDKQARLEEEAAKRKQEAAADAERQAAQESNPREKARLEAEAARQKQQAQAAQQRAEEMKQQALRDRQDAAQQNPRSNLTDARQHQEEVEKTLNELLARLEPWSSARELKGEAKRLLQEQKQLEAELETRKDRQQGRTPEQLTPNERADLQDLKEQQQRLEERMTQLQDKMDRLAEQRNEKDPETARELREAREQALKGDITGKMKAAGEQIGQNKLNEATKSQKEGVEELERLVKNMEDRREQELDRLARKLKEAEQRLEELKDEQEKLARKIRQAEQNPNAERREQELKHLAREQKQLQEKSQELLKQLTRLRADRASQALGKAGAQMEQAGQQMRQGKEPEDPQEALDRLNEAQREVQRARKQAEEELQREQLVRVAETLGRIKERQEALNNEAARIQTEVQQNGKWSRGLLSSLSQLGESEKGLSEEADNIAEKDLVGTPVFARMIRRAAEAMRDTQKRGDQLRQQMPDVKTLPDAELSRAQQLALLRLNQVLEAVKEQSAATGPGGRQQPAGGGPGGGDDPEEGGNRGGQEDSGLPPVAQLKLLKTLQLEVNKATEEFKKRNPDAAQLNDAEKIALANLRKQQQDVLDLLEEMRGPAEEPAAPEGEKK